MHSVMVQKGADCNYFIIKLQAYEGTGSDIAKNLSIDLGEILTSKLVSDEIGLYRKSREVLSSLQTALEETVKSDKEAALSEL